MRLTNRNLLVAAIGALGAIWCLAVFAATDHFMPLFLYIGSLTFVIAAVALAILYLTVLRRSPGRQAAEPGALPVLFTLAYVVAIMGSNTVLVFLGRGSFNKFSILCNAAINAVYILLILWAEKDNQRLSAQLERTERKLSGPVAISAKLGEILGLTEDRQLREQLLKLKEAVDYSTNITTGATFERERQMERQLDELRALIVGREEPSAIQNKLHEVELTWKTRGSAAGFRG